MSPSDYGRLLKPFVFLDLFDTQGKPFNGFGFEVHRAGRVLGGLGVVLPGLVRIRTGLTSLAATGLVIIMIGATVVMWSSGMVAVALMNMIVALLAVLVAYGRWRLAPYRDSTRPSVLRPA